MAVRDFSHYILYRWRYVIGYSLIGILLAGLLVFAGVFVPGGISETEMTSVVSSEALSFSDIATLGVTNLPYYALQKGILHLFGVSILTIKLASLILSLLTAVGIVLLLRRWFKPNIAVLTSIIAVSTGQFLYLAQSGIPSILYLFWPVALLLLGTQVTRGKKYRLLWKVLFAITAALSLYTPLAIYPLLAIALAIAFHPHLRNVVRRLSKVRLTIVGAIFLVLTAPLIWFVIITPALGLSLLGITPEALPIDISANALTVLKQYFLFWESSNTRIMTPVFGLGSVVLIGLGSYRLFMTRDTTRSYLIIFWILCLIPVLIINPAFTSVTFLPSVLVLAAGLTSLIGYWYRLFPLNPYARIAGLIPIIILVGALVTTGLARYIYGYHYNPQVASLFNNDISLLPKDTAQLVVSDSEKEFYTAVATYQPTIKPVTAPTDALIVVTRDARDQIGGNYTIKRIITSGRSTESDRLYVMQRVQ